MVKIEGTVEDIVFRNEENGWTVLSLKAGKEHIAAVGTLGDVIEGERAILEGEWTEHSEYGTQLRVSSCQVLPPDTKRGMERFLASGFIRGVGPATAKLIMQHFGKNAFDVLQNEPHRLCEIPGIGRKKAAMIAESFAQRQEMRQTMVFLQTYGLSSQLSARIYKAYGPNSQDIVQHQPYRLVTDIRGVGFLTADKLARSMGMSQSDPARLRAGVFYALNEATNTAGHCYLPYEQLVNESQRLLGIERQQADIAAREIILQGQLLRRTVNDEDAIYNPRMYEAETEVAQRLAALAVRKLGRPADARRRIEKYEREYSVTLSEEQRAAVLASTQGGLTVVTGGPGTGKTTCIRCMLDVLSFAGKTVLCAPTGRAAKRMSEASGCEAKTIHRLLEYGGEEGSFLRNAENPIDAQVVIVDEVSMVDLQLMRALLRALAPGVRLVFVGDKDQLPPVGAGNVLADLIASKIVPVNFLTRIYRQGDGSRIVDNAHRINAGEMPVWNGKGSDFFFERYDTQAQAAQAVVKLVSDRLPRFLNANPKTAIQTMAPMKKGEAGVWKLNALLQDALNPAIEGEELRRGDVSFRKGDRVMQVRNNYQKEWTADGEDGTGVFNGDIGFVAQIDKTNHTVQVLFDENRLAEYDDADLDDLELAYCMSVHKSQGGEFDCVVLPLVAGPPMLMTRNLLYTAVTRAKKLVVLVGKEACVYAMVRNDHVARRYSGLAERLRQMASLAGTLRGEDGGQ